MTDYKTPYQHSNCHSNYILHGFEYSDIVRKSGIAVDGDNNGFFLKLV